MSRLIEVRNVSSELVMVGETYLFPSEFRIVAEEAVDQTDNRLACEPHTRPVVYHPPIVDDLAEIRGITPATAATLSQIGITTFEGLAAADAEKVSESCGKSKIAVERWQSQADSIIWT